MCFVTTAFIHRVSQAICLATCATQGGLSQVSDCRVQHESRRRPRCGDTPVDSRVINSQTAHRNYWVKEGRDPRMAFFITRVHNREGMGLAFDGGKEHAIGANEAAEMPKNILYSWLRFYDHMVAAHGVLNNRRFDDACILLL